MYRLESSPENWKKERKHTDAAVVLAGMGGRCDCIVFKKEFFFNCGIFVCSLGMESLVFRSKWAMRYEVINYKFRPLLRDTTTSNKFTYQEGFLRGFKFSLVLFYWLCYLSMLYQGRALQRTIDQMPSGDRFLTNGSRWSWISDNTPLWVHMCVLDDQSYFQHFFVHIHLINHTKCSPLIHAAKSREIRPPKSDQPRKPGQRGGEIKWRWRVWQAGIWMGQDCIYY